MKFSLASVLFFGSILAMAQDSSTGGAAPTETPFSPIPEPTEYYTQSGQSSESFTETPFSPIPEPTEYYTQSGASTMQTSAATQTEEHTGAATTTHAVVTGGASQYKPALALIAAGIAALV